MGNFIKDNYHKIIYLLLYLSLIVAYFFDENVTNGAYKDLQYTLKQVKIFETDFFFSFFNYDTIEYPNRLSPIYISILVFFKKIFHDFDLVRLVILHFLLLNQTYFYKALKIVNCNIFNFNKKNLLVLSCVIFISPNFRANIIWVESSMIGLLFFNIGLYYFLKNYKYFSFKNVLLNIFFIALASYVRPSYCLFALYFFYYYFTYHKKDISIIIIFLINIFLALPALYYVFVMKIFFIKFGGLSNNYFNKIPIIFSIISFHLLPFIYFLNFNYTKIIKLLSIAMIASGIVIFFFNYDLKLAGGGFFLHLSNLLFENNLLFYFLLPIIIYFIFQLISFSFKNNFLLIIIMIFITPQYHIFHKYYDPLIYIIFCTIFFLNFNLKKLNAIKFNLALYSFILFHYMISFINTYYIKF